MKSRFILTQLKAFFLHSKSFDDLTRRVGAVLLLIPCLVGIPLGVHRPWLGLKGWWLFPCLFAVSCGGVLLYVNRGGTGWALLTTPYTLAIAHDLWLVATVPLSSVPKGETQ
jgi:hypothetical protein